MKYFNENEMKCKCCRQLPEEARVNCVALVDHVLDPVREQFGKSIKTNSFYRCSRNNIRCGGTRASQHLCLGHNAAADVCAVHSGYTNMTEWKEANREIARLIIKNGKFDQLILENVGENDLLPQWVHVSYKSRGGVNRGQVLKKVTGRAGYPALTSDEIKRLLFNT